MIVFWSPNRRARLLRPFTGLTIGGLAVVALLVRAVALVVRECLYRHVVVLPLEYRSTDDVVWGFSDPLDTSPVGPWLAQTPYFRTRTDLRFSTAKQADHCSAGLPGSIRI